MDAIGVQARGRGGHPHHPVLSKTQEKGFYQILMSKIEMDCKDVKRFFRRIQLSMNGYPRCASRGSGGGPPPPPCPPPTPMNRDFNRFDEQDGDGLQR